jgi:laminin gamma 1
VRNRQCDACKEGYWNIQSGAGCGECKCNPLGSFNLSCDSATGQCFCRPGVQGLKCDSCRPLHYGFSDEGCAKCDCDPFGTEYDSLQCDEFGRCECRANFAGLKCNKCEENFYNFTSGCLKCDECYNLVQNKVNLLRGKIAEIQSSITRLLASSGSSSVNDQTKQLQRKLDSLRGRIDTLHSDMYERQGLMSNYKDSVAHFKV